MASVTINGVFYVQSTDPVPAWVFSYPVTDFFLGEAPFTASSPYNGGAPYKKTAVAAVAGTGAFLGSTECTFSVILQSTVDATINAVTARWGMFAFGGQDVPQLMFALSELDSFWLETTPTTLNLYDLRAQQGDTPDFPESGGDATVSGNLIVTGSTSVGTSLAVGTTLAVAGGVSLQSWLRFMSGATPWLRMEALALNKLSIEKGDGTVAWTIDTSAGSLCSISSPVTTAGLGTVTNPIGFLRAAGAGGLLMYDGSGNVQAGITSPASTMFKFSGVASDGAGLQLPPKTASPATPASSAEANIYVKGGKLIFHYNDAGTERWKYLDLATTGVTWVHSASAP